MIASLVLFGATGDLARRFLLPALAMLHAAGLLPEGFRVVGSARDERDDEGFRRLARDGLDEHAPSVPAPAREAFVGALRYRPADLGEPKSVARVVDLASDGDGRAVAAYLALPPGLFPTVVNSLGAIGLPPGSRVVLEKPFGHDLDSAMTLNALLAEVFGDSVEQVVFRVDHVLGMATVQNLLGLRFANRVVDAVWNSTHIEQVDLLWEETLALEGRAGFYDRAGALRDVMQNHLLQILGRVAMELPAGPSPHDRTLEVLRSVRPLRPDEAASRTRRARYTAGRLGLEGGGGGRTVPAYADEPGVDPSRGTETFAEVVLELDSERWAGTRFVLRAGKALAERRKGVLVRFRQLAERPVDIDPPPANQLWVGVDGPNDLTLHLTGTAVGRPPRSVPLALSAPPPDSELPPYAHVILDILHGHDTRSVRGDEAEEAWRVVSPVLRAWEGGLVPLEEYPAGSTGPPGAGPRSG